MRGLAWLIVILAPIVVMVIAWALARNAMAMKRDIDERFERLQNRLETDATKALETLLRDKSGKHDSR